MLKIGMFFTIVYGFKAVTEKIFLSDVFFQSSSTKSKMILQDLDFYRKLFISNQEAIRVCNKMWHKLKELLCDTKHNHS